MGEHQPYCHQIEVKGSASEYYLPGGQRSEGPPKNLESDGDKEPEREKNDLLIFESH